MAGFTLSVGRYTAGSRLGWHDHANPGLTFVLAGALVETFRSRAVHAAAGSVIAKPPDAAHTDVYGPRGATCLVVEVNPERVHCIREYSPILDQIALIQGGDAETIAARLAVLIREGGESDALLVEGLCLQLFAEARHDAMRQAPSPPWLRRVHEYLRDDCTSVRRVADVVEVAGVHPVHLARVFRARFGCTVSEYVHRCRMEIAIALLERTNLSLGDLAIRLGYADQAHFSRTFAARFGISPGRYRAMKRHANT